jgi:hypothetical protein
VAKEGDGWLRRVMGVAKEADEWLSNETGG